MSEFSSEFSNMLNPDFVSKLDLTKAPFSDLEDPELYYESDNKHDIQKKIHHLVEYTNLVLFIQGAEGVGKTSLIKSCITHKDEQWKISYINANNYKNIDFFVEKIAQDFEFKLGDNKDGSEALSLQQQLDNLNRDNQIPILIIDDIEQLHESLIPTILSLINIDHFQQTRLHLIVIGQDIPLALLNNLPKNSEGESLKYLPALPFSEKETGDYIRFRMKKCGYDKNGIFKPAIINKIYLDAKGFPKTINQLANVYLSQYAQGKIEKPSLLDLKENYKSFKILAGTLAIVVTIILISITFSGDDDDFQKITETQLKIPEAQTESTPINVKTLVENKTKPAELIKKSIDKTEDKPVNAKTLNAANATTANRTEPSTAKTTGVASSKDILKTQPGWLLQQNPNHFTLQLLGSTKRSSAQSFIKKYNLNSDAHIFESLRNGKPWFSVIYKSFPSHKQASIASSKLPKSIQKSKPWIRQFSQVFKIIKK